MTNTPARQNQLAHVKHWTKWFLWRSIQLPSSMQDQPRPTLHQTAIPPKQILIDQITIPNRFPRGVTMPHAHHQTVPSWPTFQQWCKKHTNMTQKIHRIANCKKVNILIHLLSRTTAMTHANNSATTKTTSIPAKFGWIMLHKPTWSSIPNSTTEGIHLQKISMTYQLETTSTIQCHHVRFCRLPDNSNSIMLSCVDSTMQPHTCTRLPVQSVTRPQHKSQDWYIYTTNKSWNTTMHAFSNWYHKDLLWLP